jgi:alkanesulfonate monooxygenase SsuD/methylene tetrahydromethanopterin reductase-like flavin-dependent oxidoreductase (luciferase family)
VLNSLGVVIGETEAIARERAEALDALADPDLVLAHNSTMVGADLAKHTTPEQVAAARGNQGISGVDDSLQRAASARGASYAQTTRKPRSVLAGTPSTIADQMQDVFEAGGCDGFVVWPTVSPTMFEDVGRLLVPELQRRGLVQREYGTGTLRDRIQS